MKDFPLIVDKEFYLVAKDMVEQDPSINQRKKKKVGFKKEKLIVGDVLFNSDLEENFIRHLNKVEEEYLKADDENKKRFFF